MGHDVQFIIANDAFVRGRVNQGIVQNRAGKERRKWKRGLNIIDVSATIIRALCGFEKGDSFYDILASHFDSIRVLYSVGKVLSLLLESQWMKEMQNVYH